MPCPFFEPREVADDPAYPRARLPLIDEYAGICHATTFPSAPPEELRFGCCNHGYSRERCRQFPAAETRSCVRLDLLNASHEALQVLVVEETDHAPVSWHEVRFHRGTGAIQPELFDPCARAQVVAFCQSYLRKFPAG